MKKWWMIPLFVVLAVAAALAGVSAYFGHTLTRAERDRVVGSAADFGLRYDDIAFRSAVDLRGFTRIGVRGFSTGATTAMLAAENDPAIRAVVEDSGYGDLTGILHVQSSKRTQEAPRPLFIIHGEADATIPVQQVYRPHAAYPRSELWVLPSVGHTGAFEAYPQEYVRKATAVFDAALQ